MRKLRLASTALTFVVASAITVASAQSYPTRPISVAVPFPPGGQVDTVSRLLIDGMRTSLGQPLVVENVGGASGTIGTGRAVRATPDGYTIVMGNWTSHVGGPAMYTINYDILNDLEPVSMLLIAPTVIVGRQTLPPNTLPELIAWLKANGDKATAATVGAGSPGHVSGIHFQNVTGTRFQFVPYRGGGPANRIWWVDRSTCGSARRRRRCFRTFAPLGPRVMPCCPAGAGLRCPIFRPRTKPALPASISRCGPGFGCRKTPRGRSSRGSMLRWCRPWLTRPRASASRTLASRFRRAISRRPKPSPRSTGPRPESGGRSSRRRISGRTSDPSQPGECESMPGEIEIFLRW
jgi:hypothetical protein